MLTARSFLVALATLTALGVPAAHAEDNAPLHIEFIVEGHMATPAMPEPPKAEAKSDAKGDAKMPPPPPAPMAMLPMANLAEMTAAKTKDAMEQATKIAEALSAQWPKCRFHIASVTPFQGGGAVMMAGPGMNAQMLVTLSGESGCLATGK